MKDVYAATPDVEVHPLYFASDSIKVEHILSLMDAEEAGNFNPSEST